MEEEGLIRFAGVLACLLIAFGLLVVMVAIMVTLLSML